MRRARGSDPGVGDLGGETRWFGKEIPDPKRHADNFEPAEDVKLVPLDPTNPNGKALSMSTTLDPK
jgi:hypothetical protein